MHPILLQFTIFGKEITIGTYGALINLASITAILLGIRLAARFRYKAEDSFTYAMIIVLGGIAGAFVAGFFIFLPERLQAGFFNYSPVLVSWGGILGGLAGALALKKYWRADLLDIADLGTPSYLIGIGIGRIGCFFGGCCFGVHTDSAIGVTFTHPIAAASLMKQPLVPTQLISAMFLITAGLLFIPFVLKKKGRGYVFASSALVYSAFRFTIEFWREDARAFMFGLSDGQLFSVVFFVLGAGFLLYKKITGDTKPAGLER